MTDEQTKEAAIVYSREIVSVVANLGMRDFTQISVSSGGGPPDTIWVANGQITKMKRYHAQALEAHGIPFEIVESATAALGHA